ncbi:MAG: DNA internalization-related competence protein ComEC/Rec2 [Dehalococcoidia bacterium]|nr:DNA internalization-related competence protein ComEC/Rec2 [Dehalococcoidia bacterium]
MKLAALVSFWMVGLLAWRLGEAGPALAALLIAAATAFVFTRFGPALAAGAILLAVGGFIVGHQDRDGQAIPALPFDGDFAGQVIEEPLSQGRFNGVSLEVEGADGWEGRSVLLTLPAFADVGYGDRLRVRGGIQPLDLTRPYERYLAEQGYTGRSSFPEEYQVTDSGGGSPVKRVLLDIRREVSGGVDSVLSEPASSLARGMLIGERADIPNDLKRDLSAAGTAHLIAISGQNVALLAGAVLALLGGLIGRYSAGLVAAVMIVLYALLLGLPPAIVRASVMGGVFVLAPIFGRQSNAPAGLAITVVAITAWDPGVLNDLSFQLSFASVAGLIVLAGPFTRVINGRLGFEPSSPLGTVVELMAVTVAATLATMPIIAINFGTLSLVSPIANLLVVPAFVPMLVASLVAWPASYLPAPLDAVTAWPAWLLLEYFRVVTTAMAALPGALLRVDDFSSSHSLPWYGGLALLGWVAGQTVADREPRARGLAWGPAVLVPVLLVAGVYLWLAPASSSDHLRVTFLDVGQGDAVLIETEGGARVLVDGGPDPERIAEVLDESLGFGDRRIDLLLLSHVAQDHAAGAIRVLERYDVGAVAWNGLDAVGPLGDAWLLALADTSSEVHVVAAGDRIVVDGLVLDVTWPSEGQQPARANDGSLVVMARHGDVDILLTGDIEATAEAGLLATMADLEADLLKVAHHGSAGSTLDEFLAATTPRFAVIMAGRGNPYGHPRAEVLQRLDQAGTEVLRTDQDGTVSFASDGARVWLRD